MTRPVIANLHPVIAHLPPSWRTPRSHLKIATATGLAMTRPVIAHLPPSWRAPRSHLKIATASGLAMTRPVIANLPSVIANEVKQSLAEYA